MKSLNSESYFDKHDNFAGVGSIEGSVVELIMFGVFLMGIWMTVYCGGADGFVIFICLSLDGMYYGPSVNQQYTQ